MYNLSGNLPEKDYLTISPESGPNLVSYEQDEEFANVPITMDCAVIDVFVAAETYASTQSSSKV